MSADDRTGAPQTAVAAKTAQTGATGPDAITERSPAERTRAPRHPRRMGTIALGLLLLLGAGITAAAVLPQPRPEPWILGAASVLGLSVILVVVAVLPRGPARTARTTTKG